MARGRSRLVAVVLVAGLVAGGCTGSSSGSDGAAGRAKATGRFATELAVGVDASEQTAKATFEVEPGTEEVTVTGVRPKARLSLVDADGRRLVVLQADRFGQAHFAYLPGRLSEYQTGAKAKLPTADGFIVEAGKGYTVRDEDTDPVQVSEPFTVLGRDDHPDGAFFDQQAGDLVPKGDETTVFGYVTMRDGEQLSVNVRLPGPASAGPYPTVVEYSGYGPSNPDATEPGSMIAGLLGFATVGVNMRGTGCSGGVFDVFNTAQQVDGYDAIEAIARQPWVKGAKVGMVGLSYSGITQLYTAATQPPSLAAVTSLSVLKDPWLQQWPGGVYNGGFTKSWLDERDKESSAGGASWVADRIDGGDEVCERHQELREQNIDFEAFGRSLVRRPALSDGRDLSKLVSKIDVPVYLTGAWQDEQTGPQFGDMLGNFSHAPVKRFTLFNGRHPDGYTPLVLTRWYEFLELYVAHEVPRIADGLRSAAPSFFEDSFGVSGLAFEPDRFTRFTDDQYREVRAAYEAEPDVRVLFESGAGAATAGSPVATYEKSYDSWPPADTEARSFYLGGDGALSTGPTVAGADTFANDPASASKTFFGPKGYELLAPTWDFDWTRFGDGKALSYVTEPFTEDTVLGGPGYAELFARVPDGDADVQVSINLIRPSGGGGGGGPTEWHVTTGLLRLSDRKVAGASDGLLVERTYAAQDAEPMPAEEYVPVKVALPSFAQTFRTGDRLRVVVSSPGRDFGAWSFADIGKAGVARDVAHGGDRPSRVVLGRLPGITSVPDLDAPCPSLRGQACRPYEPSANRPAD
ncbi:hypothetical protein BH10ACT1_BH10ACT1_19410 [soil metagenome]